MASVWSPEERQPLLSQTLAIPPPAPPLQPQKRSTLLTVCPYILGNELCERLAFYGLATNLVTYITQVMGGDPALAVILVAMFEGACYTTPVIGALLADSCWGRYKTIMVFSCIYLLGIIVLTLSSVIPDAEEDAETADPLQYGVLLGALAIISLGTGGIKPNVSAFGADQFNEADPQDRKEKERFFNWFYLAINVGSLIACTLIVYIQDQVSWTVGFAVPGAAMALAVLVFWAGSRNYRHIPPTESPMARVVRVVVAAMKNRWKKQHPQDPSSHRQHAVNGAPETDTHHGASLYQQAAFGKTSLPLAAQAILIPGVAPSTSGFSNHSSSYGQPGPAWAAPAMMGQYGKVSVGGGRGADPNTLLLGPGSGPVPRNGSGGAEALPPPYLPVGGQSLQRADSMLQMPQSACMSYRWLEDAVTEWQTSQGLLVQAEGLAGYTPKQVEEVKLVLRLLPIFATTAIYWTVYAQMGTLFVQQGNLMERVVRWNDSSFKIPSASMSVFNTLSIILLIYIYDVWFEPLLKRTGCYRMTLLRRQGWGMMVAALAMIYAALLESRRLSSLPLDLPACPSSACFTSSPPYGDLHAGHASPFSPPTSAAWPPPGEAGGQAGGDGQQRGLMGLGLVLGGGGLAPWGGMGQGLRSLLQAAGQQALAGLAAGGGGGGVGGEAVGGGAGRWEPEVDCLCANQPSSLHVLWQAPAYFLIGLSEVFTSIGQLEFFYDQAPDVMRSCSMALCLLSTALGSYMAGGLTALVQAATHRLAGGEWLPRDLNRGHMDYFFYLLAAFMGTNLLAFVTVAMRYQYKMVEHKRHCVLTVDSEGALAGVDPASQQAPGGSPSPASHLGRTSARLLGSAPVTISGMRQSTPLADPNPESSPTLEVYSRSLAYVPPSPNIPAPFR